MKNLISTICLLFLVATSYAQQYSFTQLIEMTNGSKAFELNMIKALNQMHLKENIITYSYHTSDGHSVASSTLPTNDTLYEPKYLFDNGIIYTESEIEDQKLDLSFEIRNRLREEGKLLNQALVDSFHFEKGKIISLIKSETTRIGFAENYNPQEKTAKTWYKWERHYYKILLIKSKLFSPNSKKLTVQYASDEEYAKILKQIIAATNYIETKEEFGSFVSNYKYLNYLISTERFENGLGGMVTIYIEK
jgi:hypothetical protein